MSNAPTIRYLSSQVVNAQGAPPYVLLGPDNAPGVYVLDTLLPANVPFILYQTHVFADQENTVRPQKLILKGEGTITAGAAILVADNIRYEKTDILQYPSDSTRDELVTVNFSQNMTAREWYVIFALAGSNIVIRSCIPEYAEPGT